VLESAHCLLATSRVTWQAAAPPPSKSPLSALPAKARPSLRQTKPSREAAVPMVHFAAAASKLA
jgi:hypothetical protein